MSWVSGYILFFSWNIKHLDIAKFISTSDVSVLQVFSPTFNSFFKWFLRLTLWNNSALNLRAFSLHFHHHPDFLYGIKNSHHKWITCYYWKYSLWQIERGKCSKVSTGSGVGSWSSVKEKVSCFGPIRMLHQLYVDQGFKNAWIKRKSMWPRITQKLLIMKKPWFLEC